MVENIEGLDMYNFVCMMANADGNQRPINILESVVSNMPGKMVKSITADFHDRYKEKIGQLIGKIGEPIYLHVDMFVGFIHAFSSTFNDTDTHTYLMRLFQFIVIH